MSLTIIHNNFEPQYHLPMLQSPVCPPNSGFKDFVASPKIVCLATLNHPLFYLPDIPPTIYYVLFQAGSLLKANTVLLNLPIGTELGKNLKMLCLRHGPYNHLLDMVDNASLSYIFTEKTKLGLQCQTPLSY